MANASAKRIGSLIRGKYRVDARLATGTMANVYSATHRNGSRVALKILHGTLAHDPNVCERFKRQGYFANSIGHAGVVHAIDDDVTEDGCPFIVMELLEGETLEARRVRSGAALRDRRPGSIARFPRRRARPSRRSGNIGGIPSGPGPRACLRH